ncbi:MAG: hypothetical protein OK438_00480 [Thaumarchaeota archaeon]|nr:hypothetical protein [Nitrososphaerota archaeon]
MKTWPPRPKLRRKYEVDESYWLVLRWRSFSRQVPPTLRRMAYTFKWRRIPKVWELSFIDTMRDLQNAGLTFDEILLATLPHLFGEDPAHVLRTWVGRRARDNPERFARTISKMFGASAKGVLGGIDGLTDKESLLSEKVPQEPPYKSLVEAIQKADEELKAGSTDIPSHQL